MWVKEILPPRPRARWLLITMRLSTSNFAGTGRTLVAVGTVRLATMLDAVLAAAPRSRTACSAASPAGGAVGATAGAAGPVVTGPVVSGATGTGPVATEPAELPFPAVVVMVPAGPAAPVAESAPACTAAPGPSAGLPVAAPACAGASVTRGAGCPTASGWG